MVEKGEPQKKYDHLTKRQPDNWLEKDIVDVIRPEAKGSAGVLISAEKLHAAADEIERLRAKLNDEPFKPTFVRIV